MDIILVVFIICTVCLPAVVLSTLVVAIFNRLTRLHILVQEGWSGIDVLLKKRYELIPNLISTVNGYAAHEAAVLEKVTQLRSLAMGSSELEEKLNAENMLTTSLKNLLAVSENYPDLKADSSFLKLQLELSQIERDLERARRYYNGCVREQNTQIASFPHNLLSGVFGFAPSQFFEASQQEKGDIKVELNK